MDKSWTNASSRKFTVSSIGCACRAELGNVELNWPKLFDTFPHILTSFFLNICNTQGRRRRSMGKGIHKWRENPLFMQFLPRPRIW